MILVLGLVAVGWIVLLALVVGMLHLATSSPTPQRTGPAALVPSGESMVTADVPRRMPLATSFALSEQAA